MSKNELPPLPTVEMTEEEFKKTNRRKFMIWGALGAAGLWGFGLIKTAEEEGGMLWPLRKVMDAQDAFWKANFNENSQASKAALPDKPLRVNGDLGMLASVDANTWRLQVSVQGSREVQSFSLEQIKSLPSVTETFELKCIEGWSQSMTCKGVRFSDFMDNFAVGWMQVDSLPADETPPYPYAGLSTIDGNYYVAMDMKSLLHPQTLLCYEINGEPLSMEHGYPLRLVASVKYGVKNIKQIGRIEFTSSVPADYWAENGYGTYLGL